MFKSQSFLYLISLFFFFNDTATTEIYTLSLHDALPIYARHGRLVTRQRPRSLCQSMRPDPSGESNYSMETDARHTLSLSPDRKSTRLNSSHSQISYAVFCLKKKK